MLGLFLLAVVTAGSLAIANGHQATLTKGVFRAGVDIEPGIYTTPNSKDYRNWTCTAFATRTERFDLEDADSDPADWLRSATAGRRGDRIEVRRGEFLHVMDCEWRRERADGPRSDDPATLVGGCAILSGKSGALAQAMTYVPGREDTEAIDDRRRGEIQDWLFAVVQAENPKLAAPAGQLVDFLDDPAGYVDEDGELSDSVIAAIATMQSECGSLWEWR